MNCYFEKKDSNDNYDIIPFDKVVKIKHSGSNVTMNIYTFGNYQIKLQYNTEESRNKANTQKENYLKWLNETLSSKSNLNSF